MTPCAKMLPAAIGGREHFALIKKGSRYFITIVP